MWHSRIQSSVLPGLPTQALCEGRQFCAFLNITHFLLRKIKCLYHFHQKNAINGRLPVVIESVNSHANRFFCIHSSGSWAFDFHLLFSLAACSVSMQISFFIQFSVDGKTTISCIIISVNKRGTANWIFMRLQLQWEDEDSFHTGRMRTKASGQVNSVPHHLPPLRNFFFCSPAPQVSLLGGEITG